MIKTGILGALAVIALAPSVFASEGEKLIALGSISTEAASDKVDQELIRAEFRRHRRDITWPYKGEREGAWDLGARTLLSVGRTPFGNYNGAKLELTGGKNVSKEVQFDGAFGFHTVRDMDGIRASAFSGEFLTTYVPNSVWVLQLDIVRDFAYVNYRPGPVLTHLTMVSVAPRFSYRPIEKIQFKLNPSRVFFSDGNVQTHIVGDAMYGLATSVPWIWVGFGGESLSYARSTNSAPLRYRYWSPGKFYSFGPKVDLNVPLNEDFSFALGAGVHRIKEDDFKAGTGFILAPTLIYGTRENFEARIGYMRIQSQQDLSVWSSDTFTLSVQYSF